MHVPRFTAFRFATTVLAAIVLATAADAALASTLNPKLLPNVEAATFEVVAAKPKHDPLTYAKPLPLNLLPYQQRTDKYHSVGTAFAIGHGRYVTAGHVLRIGRDSLWGPLAIRDSAGHVYPIDKILKFSFEKDFAVFTVKGNPGKAILKADVHPKLNTKVYAVGNALGTGIVIRGGLYTSRTPEDQDGRWKWLRFSAAASPGNSGGPLLDSHGKVIGVVLMKSPDENLNYALPIGEVLKAPDGVAEADKLIPYYFDLFNDSLSNVIKFQFSLPKTLPQFFAAYGKHMRAYEDSQLKALLAKNRKRLFPNGKGSSRLLHAHTSRTGFPQLTIRGDNGDWNLSPIPHGYAPLDDNGYAAIGKYKNEILFDLRKPDSLSASELYTHPEKLMDLLLKPGLLHRDIGNAHIKVTSLGKPDLKTTMVDKWGRRWQIFRWPMAFNNSQVIVMALPVPSGYVGMLCSGPVRRKHDFLINAKALVNFIDVSYQGTLAQWQGFLKLGSLLPAAFKHLHIDIQYGKHLTYTSPLVDIAIPQKLEKIKPSATLSLGFSFFRNHGKVVWGVSHVVFKPHRKGKRGIGIMRVVAPSAEQDDNYREVWNKLLHKRHPFDAVAYTHSDATSIRTTVNPAAVKKPAFLYDVEYDADGTQKQAYMKRKLKLLLGHVKLVEPIATAMHP